MPASGSMLLIALSVQMFLSGLSAYLHIAV